MFGYLLKSKELKFFSLPTFIATKAKENRSASYEAVLSVQFPIPCALHPKKALEWRVLTSTRKKDTTSGGWTVRFQRRRVKNFLFLEFPRGSATRWDGGVTARTSSVSYFVISAREKTGTVGLEYNGRGLERNGYAWELVRP